MIEVSGVTKEFRSELGLSFRLQPVQLVLRPGVMLAVLGTNGSGKSTLLRLLSGQLRPDSGTIEHVDEGVRRPLTPDVEHPKRLYFDQDSGRDIVPSMRLWENVLLGCIRGQAGALRFPGRQAIQGQVRKALCRVELGLEERVSEQARVLSGGQRRGLVLARALVFDNDIYLLDEFTSALTQELAQHYMSLIKSIIVERNGYCCFVTHEVPLAFKYADELMFIHGGEVVLPTTVNTVEAQQLVASLYARYFG